MNSGSVQIIIIPTNKLMISEKNPSIETVGTLEGVLDAVSPAITGRFLCFDVRVLFLTQESCAALPLNKRRLFQNDLVK